MGDVAWRECVKVETDRAMFWIMDESKQTEQVLGLVRFVCKVVRDDTERTEKSACVCVPACVCELW